MFAPAITIQSLFGHQYQDRALVVTAELLADYEAKLAQIPPDKLELKHGYHSIYIDDPNHYSQPLLLPNCAAGKYKLVVDFRGHVFPCNFFRGDKWDCGNLLTDDADEVWQNGKGFAPFRQLVLAEQLPGKCQVCLKKTRCQSGCRAWSKTYQQGGFDYACDIRCELGAAFIGS
jgi:radical SAM protein with 4Fe4S-binding SPASM domain